MKVASSGRVAIWNPSAISTICIPRPCSSYSLRSSAMTPEILPESSSPVISRILARGIGWSVMKSSVSTAFLSSVFSMSIHPAGHDHRQLFFLSVDQNFSKRRFLPREHALELDELQKRQEAADDGGAPGMLLEDVAKKHVRLAVQKRHNAAHLVLDREFLAFNDKPANVRVLK